MNEKTINEQYAYIRTLLEEKRLKEALMQLESLLWQCPDWDLRTRLEQLQTSYKYMLEYMKQGANDPDRWNLYQKMVADTWGIADQSRLLILDNASSRYYHEVRRTPKSPDLSNYGLKTILHILESFNDDLAVSGLLSDEKMDEVLSGMRTRSSLCLSEHGRTVPGLPKTRKMQKPCLPRNYFRETTYAYLSVPSH